MFIRGCEDLSNMLIQPLQIVSDREQQFFLLLIQPCLYILLLKRQPLPAYNRSHDSWCADTKYSEEVVGECDAEGILIILRDRGYPSVFPGE